MEVPCPQCNEVFANPDDLYTHALDVHNRDHLVDILGAHMPTKELTWEDFTQVDGTWVYVIGSFHLSVSPDASGNFRLQVYGSIEPIPPATKYPTEPEKEQVLDLANKFRGAYLLASKRE